MATSFTIEAVVTNGAKARMAQNIALEPNGGSFIVDKFVVGSGGHDPDNPTVALTPDPTLGDDCTGTDCPDIQTEQFDVAEVVFVSATCPVFKCQLNPGDYVGELSQILLLGRVTTPGADDIGEYFVFAVGNFPLGTSTMSDSSLLQIGVLF